MKRPILLHAALAISLAAPALAQSVGTPAVTGPAPPGPAPAIPGPDPTKAGPPITIDTSGLTGGVAGQVLLGTGLVVVDPTTGVVHQLGTQRSTSALSPTGADAAVTTPVPSTLNPAPPSDPSCRDSRQDRCRPR